MKIINKDNVSHVSIFKETKGLKFGDNFWKYTYYQDEYFKLFWLFPIKTLDEGLYRLGKKSSWYKLDDDTFNKNRYYTVLGEVYTNCHIEVFSAGKKIHTEYFEDYQDLEQHIKDNYNNCQIRYE